MGVALWAVRRGEGRIESRILGTNGRLLKKLKAWSAGFLRLECRDVVDMPARKLR